MFSFSVKRTLKTLILALGTIYLALWGYQWWSSQKNALLAVEHQKQKDLCAVYDVCDDTTINLKNYPDKFIEVDEEFKDNGREYKFTKWCGSLEHHATIRLEIIGHNWKFHYHREGSEYSCYIRGKRAYGQSIILACENDDGQIDKISITQLNSNPSIYLIEGPKINTNTHWVGAVDSSKIKIDEQCDSEG